MKDIFFITQSSREALAQKIFDTDLTTLNAIPHGCNNNILWNAGHIITVQQTLIYGLSKIPYTIDQYMIDNFKPKTKPENPYAEEVKQMIVNLLTTTTPRLEQDYYNNVFSEFIPFISKSLNTTIDTLDGVIKFNLYHEGIHTGVIQKYYQLLR